MHRMAISCQRVAKNGLIRPNRPRVDTKTPLQATLAVNAPRDNLDPQLVLHRAEQVEGLEGGHVVEVGGFEAVAEGFQERVVELEHR